MEGFYSSISMAEMPSEEANQEEPKEAEEYDEIEKIKYLKDLIKFYYDFNASKEITTDLIDRVLFKLSYSFLRNLNCSICIAKKFQPIINYMIQSQSIKNY